MRYPQAHTSRPSVPATTKHLVLLCPLFLAATAALAQTTAGGAIRGRVTDASGSAIPEVAVTARSPDVGGSFSGSTDSEGNYILNNIPPSNNYTVSAVKTGFERLEQPNIVVRAGSNATADLTLQVGAVTQSVEVKSDTNLVDQVTLSSQLISRGKCCAQSP